MKANIRLIISGVATIILVLLLVCLLKNSEDIPDNTVRSAGIAVLIGTGLSTFLSVRTALRANNHDERKDKK